MTVSYLAIDHGVKLHALYADTLPTDGMNNGDRAIISDGPDKIFIGGAWVDDGEDEGGNGQLSVTYLASAARTAEVTNGADIDTTGFKYLEVEVEATASAATPSVTVTIQGKTLSGAYYTLLASAAITGADLKRMTVGSGLPTTANLSANTPLPQTVKIITAVGDADSLTYSIRYRLSN